MKHTKFSKNRLSATISLLLGAVAMSPVIAQEADVADNAADNVEIIEVSGIRGSLARAQDIKQSSSGIVDAISSEEMGKFPDTNLAESLQRIPGVTISRSNNEGSQITVRGFGPDFNLILLNDRQMPGTGNSRSFNFENLSSEGVDTLEIYKSSRVDKPSGGLGATVNIITSQPLSRPGLKFSLSAKGLYDESNEMGEDVTPELAGIYSQTFADNTFGISLTASYQERSFRQESANIPGWLANTGPFSSASGFVDPRPEASTDDEGKGGVGELDGRQGPVFVPRQISYDVNDVQRERTNSHLTLQWAPREDMKLTADYMYNEAQTATEGFGFGIWFNFDGNVTDYELDQNGTAVRLTETGNDYAHSRTANTLLVEQDSLGLNWEWYINDDFTVEVDYHDSKITTDNGVDPGTNASSLLIIGPNNIRNKTYDYTTGEIPVYDINWPGRNAEAQIADIDPLFAQFSRGVGESQVEQFQLKGEWVNPDDLFLTHVKAGFSHTVSTNGGRSGFSGNQGPNGYNGNQAIFPDEMFTRTATGDLLDDFAGGGSDIQEAYYFDFDLSQALSILQTFFPNFTSDPFNGGAGGSVGEGFVEETTQALYVNSTMYFDIGDMPLDVNLGVRYEETEVFSSALQSAEDFIVWSNPTEWQLRFKQGENQFVDAAGEYDVLLPALDLKLEIQEGMYVRASFGKTMARSPLGSLSAARGLSAAPKPDSRVGSTGNPSLLPYESTNYDLAWEWYYAEASYVAAAYYRKDVKNFPVSRVANVTFPNDNFPDIDLRDPLAGPRGQQAIAELTAEGLQTSIENIWQRIIDNGGGVDDACCQTQIIRQNADDPLMEWRVSRPENNSDTVTVDGIELQMQHVFGDTGFGIQANATIVDTDAEFNVNSLAQQFALPGVSDSANLQLFYENDQWSVKLTHAWRDSYLLGIGQQQGTADNPPQFVAETNITDFSVNYSYDENLTFFLEGYNITNETERGFGRYEEQFLFGRQYGARYGFGARYTF
jgi:iron complex outermembrane receptor protein